MGNIWVILIVVLIVPIILIFLIWRVIRIIKETMKEPDPIFELDGDQLDKVYDATTPVVLPEVDEEHILRTCIILTTTVNVKNNINTLKQVDKDQRAAIYRKSIMRWLRYTRFKIVVVENSSFNSLLSSDVLTQYKDRLEFLCFEDPVISKSKGQHESYAINYALAYSDLICTVDYIIKITGRYFVPELESLLAEHLGPDIDYIRQHISKRCEIIGCRYTKAEHLFEYPMTIEYVEAEYDQRLKNVENSTYRLPYVQVTTVKNGGYNQDIEYL
jgi:hypothetical protein